ncbi:hypothetical protein LEMLEM_LOCUS16427 [Lemmus lemmus]
MYLSRVSASASSSSLRNNAVCPRKELCRCPLPADRNFAGVLCLQTAAYFRGGWTHLSSQKMNYGWI